MTNGYATIRNMKTTVELPDALMTAAKRYANLRKITLREVIETGLGTVLAAERGAGHVV